MFWQYALQVLLTSFTELLLHHYNYHYCLDEAGACNSSSLIGIVHLCLSLANLPDSATIMFNMLQSCMSSIHLFSGLPVLHLPCTSPSIICFWICYCSFLQCGQMYHSHFCCILWFTSWNHSGLLHMSVFFYPVSSCHPFFLHRSAILKTSVLLNAAVMVHISEYNNVLTWYQCLEISYLDIPLLFRVPNLIRFT